MGKKFEIKDNDVSDTYHTFNELYDHRNLLFITVCNFSFKMCYLVKEHYEGHFLLVIELPNGQVSYHIGNELLYLVSPKIEVRDVINHNWDGHTPNGCINSWKEYLEGMNRIGEATR